ncbi:putative quinol monooxygenase [Rothia terrae]|uniref:putative quinol monooxygenase n=1 Tax=Rothia terrae TaxID=396015 RepID=UPI0033CA24E1
MIGVRAAIEVNPDNIQEFIAIAQELVEASRQETTNISYDFGKLAGSETSFAFIERWEDQKALDQHMQTSHFTGAVAAWEKHLAAPLDVEIYTF